MLRTRTTILILAVCCLVVSAAVAQDAYPPSGYDVVSTSATVSLYDPGDPNLLLETMVLTGNAVIWRGNPYDPGDGRLTIDTRMDTLLLRGFSLTYGDSAFVTLNRAFDPANGIIRQVTPHIDFPAESFFDLYFRLTIGSEPANPSPGQDPDGEVFRGSYGYDMQSKTGSLVLNAAGELVAGKAVPFTAQQPVTPPVDASVDKGTRQGGDNIGSATYIPAVPYTDQGTTCGYINDYDEVCPYTGSTAPDVVYSLDPPTDALITISLCSGSQYDTKLYVYDQDLTLIACNDDACPGYVSEIPCLQVYAGNTYYIVVDGYATDCGAYVLTIVDCEIPCVVDCAAGSYQEQEPCGADDNGGCNSTPPQFEPIDCGIDVCGTAWADGGTRDTDWYEFTLTSEAIISVTGSAEFPYVLGFVDTSDCAIVASVDPAAVGNPCDTLSASRIAGPGTYWVFMAVNDYNNYPCGTSNNYFFQLRCVPTGFNSDSTHMADTIWQIPPHGRVYKDPRKVPIRDAAGNIIGYTWHEHKVDPPQGGTDTIPTIGLMPVWVGPNPPGGTQPPDETIRLTGTAIIARSDPYINEFEQPEIQTEILSMDLTGESALFGPTTLSLPYPAPGQVTSLGPDEFFPAESFFDVYYQIDLPALGQIIEPLAPPRMQTTVEALPPVDNQYTQAGGEPHPVHDVQNPGIPIGWVLPIHWVQPRDTTPPPPPDTVPTIGIMPVIVGPTPPVVGQTPDETIYLAGDAIIQREINEYDDPTSGQHVIENEMLVVNLTGSSNLFGSVILSLPQPALGQDSYPIGGPNFPAESFFDVYYEVDLPDQGHAVRPTEPVRMQTQINQIPPLDNKYLSTGWHPIVNPQLPTDTIGWVQPTHWVNPPPTGACCDTATGACSITTQVDCENSGGVYQGDGTTCVPNPCELPCTGWLPGTSTIWYSSFQIDIYDPNDNTNYLGTAYAFGAGMVVQRNAPYEVSPGIWRMDTDILAFAGIGNSSLLGGQFSISLDPNLPSSGYIQMCDSCDDNWAESHFDINYRVHTQLAAPNDIYYSNALMDLPCDQQWDPYSGGADFTPPNGHSYVDPRKVPIYNDAGELVGYTMKKHRVDKDPLGACCEAQTNLCFITTAADCEASGGTYMGDSTGCDPNPCEQPCETGWTPGVDTVTFSAFEVDVYDPNDNTIYLGTAYAFGVNMIIQRNAPYEVSPGIYRMDTDILQFSGNGNSPLLGGPFTIGLDGSLASGGYIQMCDSCNDNWAESHFDINYEISTTMPAPRHLLHGNALMDLPCSENWNPFPGGGPFTPPNGHSYNDPRKVPIYDADGNIIGYTMKRHHVADDELGACCDTAQGTCRMTTQVNCDPPLEVWQGPGTTCFPNPCVCTDWIPGIDTILFSAFEVELFDPNDNTISLGTLTAFGANMVVARGVPYEVSPGIYRMDTDILAFGGAGTSPLVGGPFSIDLDPDLISGGYIQMCDSCNDNWAESHFDLNYRVTTTQPFPDDILKGNALMDLPCDEQWNPFPGGGPFTPPDGHSYVDPRKVPIYNENGEIIGYTMKKHTVDKDPLGACCDMETGACFITSAVRCEIAGGMYMGDNVPCVPNPCDTGCGTGWTPGVDTIPGHDFEIELYDNSGTVLITTLTATGVNMVIVRTAPWEVSPGIFRMGTQVVEFSGAGSNPVLGGPFEIHLNPNLASGGYIQMCDSCNDNWAESFFDIFYVITTTLPFPMDTLFGDPAQMHLACSGNWDPYQGGAFTPPFDNPYNDPRIVPIYDHNGEVIGQTRKRHIPRITCCLQPIRGDVNHDGLPTIDISDLVYLVDYMFTNGPWPPCWSEANIDCSDGVPQNGVDGQEDIDISDLVYLVDYMFTGGPEPCPCDCVLGESCYPVKSGSSSKVGQETMRKWSSHVAPVTTPTSRPTGATR